MNEVSGAGGVVTYEADSGLKRQATAALIGVVALISFAVLGRRLR
jgi:hypothetical protein